MTKTGSLLNGIAFSAALLLAACTEPAAPVVAAPVPSAAATETVVPAEVHSQQPVTEIPLTAQLNPPHGEPGHDCAIPVGAPLDGGGNAANSVVMPMSGGTSTPTTVVSPSSGTGKLNPAHGEPGHDCAVPVGSPLPG